MAQRPFSRVHSPAHAQGERPAYADVDDDPLPPPAADSVAGDHLYRWRELPAVPTSARAARIFVTEALAAWGHDDLAYDAATIASELSTNAIVHAPGDDADAGPFHISVRADTTRLTIMVSDLAEKPLRPFPGEPGDDVECGRGLGIVEAYSQDWGWRRSGATGKTVWATLDLSGGG